MSINLTILIVNKDGTVEQVSLPRLISRQLAKDVGYDLDVTPEISVLRDASPVLAIAVLECLEFNYTCEDVYGVDLLQRAIMLAKDSKSVTVGWW